MAYTGMTATNPLALPGTIDPSGSLVETNPLPPPGRYIDGTADLHPMVTGHYAAVAHVYTCALGGTITQGEVWTMTITPTTTVNGQAIADALNAITLSVTVDATATATSVGDLFVTAWENAKSITTTVGVSSTTRIGEIVGTMVNAAGTLTLTGAMFGETWTAAGTQEAGGLRSTQTPSTRPGPISASASWSFGMACTRTGSRQ
jgi:hypothetical protein